MASTITELLRQWNDGDEAAFVSLLPLVYDQLHQIASRQLNNEQHVSLQPTELLNEMFVRLSETETPNFRNRAHFYGAMAELMRRILIDLARKRSALKRGSSAVRVALREDQRIGELDLDVEALDQAMDKLAAMDARLAEVVNLRFYVGLNSGQAADVLGVSEATVKRDWAIAKTWLLREMSGE
ncbi:MAG: ECF-type sigma factor [Bryobacteraceae bacterium]